MARERPDVAVHVVAVEIDAAVIPALAETLADCERVPGVSTELVVGDFLERSTGMDPDPRLIGPFDLVLMNPPYGKQAAADHFRRAVAREHVDTPNLYSGFWALGVAALEQNGQCVAIVPRSWANGTYFEPFRRWLLNRVHLDTLHVFESRNTVFADTGVLQENVIVSSTRGGRRVGPVTLSASVGDADDVTRQIVPLSAVVQPDDPHTFVRFTDGAARVSAAARFTLAELGLSVSTGRVVDFRARDHLGDDPAEPGTVPLIYPGNLRNGVVEWPRAIHKAQAFRTAMADARKLLVPAGTYTLTKRFSAKEERRRVVAAVWSRDDVQPAFENHLNYFHDKGGGLPADLARGLSLWLNSTAVDQLFRTFSGHTQVNAGDLRALPYPSRERLSALGREVPGGLPDQKAVDAIVSRMLGDVVARRAACPLMEHARLWGTTWAPNTRETIRRFTLHQFVDAGLVEYNHDNPARPVNSPKANYRVAPAALAVITSWGLSEIEDLLAGYLLDLPGQVAGDVRRIQVGRARREGGPPRQAAGPGRVSARP